MKEFLINQVQLTEINILLNKRSFLKVKEILRQLPELINEKLEEAINGKT